MKITGRKTWQPPSLSIPGCSLPLRQRYFLTRRGRLRARYLALPVLAIVFAATSATAQFLSDLNTPIPHETGVVYTAAVQFDADPVEKLQTTQKRLQRYARHEPMGADNATNSAENITLAAAPQSQLLPPQQLRPREKTIVVDKGDTMAGVLQKAGLDENGAYQAVLAMEKIYDPRTIRPGQRMRLLFNPAAENQNGHEFSRLTMEIDALDTLHLQRAGDGEFVAKLNKKETVRRQHARQANIELSLYGSALKAGIPSSIVANAIRIFSWDVDFQRDIRQGDALEVMYDQIETEDGTPVENGDIVYARLNVNGDDIQLYRFETADGSVDYYTPDGASIRKALMTTPVDGARLSSGFGMREHPVLGYTKMHKGIDFAAPTGTPIYAAGDGVIEHIGKWSSFGNYIRIRHNSGLKTAYAHMKGFAKGLSKGSRVKQGQAIGYIGTTGRSTGPHLHYEVLVNGAQVNPRTVKMQQGDTLKGKQLAAFRNHIDKVNRQYAALSNGFKMASIDTASSQNLR